MPSRARLNSTLTLAFLAVATVLVYAPRLDEAHLHHDEVSVALQARSIAASGRDGDGRSFPLYFHMRDDDWAQPVLVYVTALFLRLSPAGTVRLATVAIGVLDVLLMFALARRLFKSDGIALIASGLLALTPAHFMYSRVAMDAVYPVPFVTAWLLCLVAFLDEPRPWRLALATTCLGLGFYSHATAVLIMPACVLLTALALGLEGVAAPRLYAIAVGAFLLPLLLLAPWFLLHPHTYIDTVGRWGVHPAYIRNPLEGLRALTNRGTLTSRVWIFWDFFNPSYLFFVGNPNAIGSTHRTGVFLLPTAVFLPVGLHHWLTSARSRAIGAVLVLGFVAVPLVASTFNERQATANELAMLPFAVLITTSGVAQLVTGPAKRYRLAALALLALMAVQFAYFGHASVTAADTPQTTAFRSAP